MELYTQHQAVFQAFGIQNLEVVAQKWQEPHRFYHTEKHLAKLLQGIEQISQEHQLNEADKQVLIMSAYFHDVIYDPLKTDNEAQSAHFFAKQAKPGPQTELVKEIILDTQAHKAQSRLSELFIKLDMQVVYASSFQELLDWEKQIFKEYQYLDYSIYKQGRLLLLKKFLQDYPENAHNLEHLITYIENYRPNIGVYPGSFNPFHYGHLNILEKAEKIFDKVIIARGINPDKNHINTNPLDREVLKYRQVENFSGFLTDYLSSKEDISQVNLVRGLRNGDDLDYEINQLRFMEEMKPDLRMIFIACDKEFEHISSSSIKNLNKIDPNFSKRYVPE